MIQKSLAARLDQAIRQVCPIWGVSIGDPSNRRTWRFRDKGATASEREAAQRIIDTFDVNAPLVKTLEERVRELETRVAKLEKK